MVIRTGVLFYLSVSDNGFNKFHAVLRLLNFIKKI